MLISIDTNALAFEAGANLELINLKLYLHAEMCGAHNYTAANPIPISCNANGFIFSIENAHTHTHTNRIQ